MRTQSYNNAFIKVGLCEFAREFHVLESYAAVGILRNSELDNASLICAIIFGASLIAYFNANRHTEISEAPGPRRNSIPEE
jgi:hypothetical protein